MSEEVLTRLKKKRGYIRSSITKHLTKMENDVSKSDVNLEELEESLELLNDRSTELSLIDTQIEELVKLDEIEAEYAGVEEYRDRVTRIKHKAVKLIKKANKETESSNISSQAVSLSESRFFGRERVKLPELTIPKFFGEISEWLNFWNAFSSAIHENVNLSKIDKFNYLRSFLAGSAFNVIEGLQLTSDHYDHAIDLLKQRFGNKSILINVHIENLLQTSPLRNSNDVKGFRNIFNHIQKNIRSLESLSVVKDNYASILVPILTKLLPRDLILEFNKRERKPSACEIDELIEFLSSQLTAREMTYSNFSYSDLETRPPNRHSGIVNRPTRSSASVLINESFQDKSSIAFQKCIFCQSVKHSSAFCTKEGLGLKERLAICRRSGSCYRCLNDKIKKRHLSYGCTAKVQCGRCMGRHVTLMCMGKKKVDPKGGFSEAKSEVNSAMGNSTSGERILLQTLVVGISGSQSKQLIRIIIDTGSSCSYISEFAARSLKLKSVGQDTIVHGLFGGSQKKEKHKRYTISLSSIDNGFTCELKALEQKTICAPIPKLENRKVLDEIRSSGIFPSDVIVSEGLCLYDNHANEIHGLIGADYAGKVFTGEIKNLSNGLVAMNTYFGWTLMGGTGESRSTNEVLLSLYVGNLRLCDLWSLDSLGIVEPSISQTRLEIEEAVKNHFVHTLKRDSEGRYQVSLPWLEVHPELSDNRDLAEKRLKSCVRALQKRNCLLEYENVFGEWLADKIIAPVGAEELERDGGHYLPHRPVFKENSTTKIRPVFDASAKVRNSVSLNDCIEKGPNYLELIPRLINRFRQGKYGVISDIRKAFLQIKIDPLDRKFLRFLWWEKGDPKKLIVFSHCRVVFGVSASPFLLAATINHHLEGIVGSRRDIALKLRESMYVDNCVGSVDTVEELNSFIEVSRELMSSAQLDLRGWRHNRLSERDVKSVLNLSEDDYREIVSVLGVEWNLDRDTLSCSMKGNISLILTKRNVLSVLGRIFDPIGFTSPVSLIPKLILQECWREKVGWDTELPDSLGKKFLRWASELKYLADIGIPRRLPKIDDSTTLHVFVDASRLAYAASIFVRSDSAGVVTCQLLQARSRVAPLKPITIPRLEVLACTIGARLAYTVREDLNMKNIPVFYYTDSMNALYWIKKQDNWATFVANRVNEIRKLTDAENWRHIKGKFNPADLPSRGCCPKELSTSHWWEGPKWLKLPLGEWPTSEIAPDIEVVNSERKKNVISATNLAIDRFAFFEKVSSFTKITRIMAYVLRFIKNVRSPNDRQRGELVVKEIELAERVIFKEIQRESFADKKMLNLRTIRDIEGLLRIETRIASRKDSEAFRFPILLPNKHQLVEKLIRSKHVMLNHAGTQSLMTLLRENYWIVKSRKIIRQVVRNCGKCKRFSAKPLQAVDIPLPEDRVREAAVFEVVGVDLCGPLILRGEKKCWVVLFTCAVYRAIHLELVNSLSTDSFILALRRFIARRGRPSTVYSDNGKNLVGTANFLKKIDWKKIERFSSVRKIQWKFNPPSAPWWGGFWERLIGLLKNLLKRVLARACLSEEELLTVLCDAESLINCRPLTYVSEDPEDLISLSPALFLQDLKETGVPDLDSLDAGKLKKRYAYRLKLRHDVRTRFRNEYLGLLRDYAKTRKESSVKVGDVVLIGDVNCKRIDWPLARVEETYPGRDGRVRVVKLKTQTGVLIRPIQRLYLMEAEVSDFPARDHPEISTTCPVESQSADEEQVRCSRYGRPLRPVKR